MDSGLLKEKIEVVLKMDEEQNQGIQINLREIIEVIIKGKWLIAIIVIASLLMTFVAVPLTTSSRGTVTAIVSLNFDGIEKGLDPYGKTFDVSKMKAPVVLDKVVESLGLSEKGISSNSLRTNIEIVPVIPGDITQKITDLEEAKKLNVKDSQDFTYYPSNYTVTLNIPNSFDVSGNMAREILDEVVKQYQQYFYNQYSDKSVLANALGQIDYEEYDYPEVSTVMHNQINLLTNYLGSKIGESGASDFRAKSTGLSFNDIIETVGIISRVDLNRMDSIIGAYNLTKDKEKLIKLYEYRIKADNLNTNKKVDEAKVYENRLSKYEKDKSLVVLPGLTAGDTGMGTVELEKGNTYYDDLNKNAAESKIDSTNSLHDADYYRNEINRLKNDTVSEPQKKEAVKDVLKMIPGIKAKLENWTKLTNESVAEYYETMMYNRAVTSLSPAGFSSAVKADLMLGLAIALLIGIILSMIVVFFREYWRRSVDKGLKV